MKFSAEDLARLNANTCDECGDTLPDPDDDLGVGGDAPDVDTLPEAVQVALLTDQGTGSLCWPCTLDNAYGVAELTPA